LSFFFNDLICSDSARQIDESMMLLMMMQVYQLSRTDQHKGRIR